MQIDRKERARQFVTEFEALPANRLRQFDLRKRQKILDEYLTQKCIVDFWTCLKYLYRDAIHHYWPALHGPAGLAGYLQDWTRIDKNNHKVMVGVKFVVISRELCKTQTTVAWDVWNWICDPNLRTLCRAYTDPKAEEIGRSCRAIIEKPWFQKRFPWVRPATVGGSKKPVLWKANQFMLERDDVSRTPSFEACGIKTDPTGGHFHTGHFDDFEVRENTQYLADRDRLIKTWRSDSNLFVAASRRVMCGTPWHKASLINAVVTRGYIEDVPEGGDFTKHDYDVFFQPCTIQQDFSPFDVYEPVLHEDRRTIKAPSCEFPTEMNNLVTCQLRATFFDPAIADTTVETREVVYNTSDTVRVNRAFSGHLGQPIMVTIGNEKPAAPNRMTLDVTDLSEVVTHEAPAMLKDYKQHPRTSLPKKERDQGPFVFSSQMKLRPMASDSLIFSADDIERIEPDELPEGIDYRACDFATADKTAASSVISYGRWTKKHFIITKVVRKNQMKNSDKILELVLGARRAYQAESPLRVTFFEQAQIERTLMDYIDQACRDPFAYFTALGGFYAKMAAVEFKESGPVTFLRRILKRPRRATKNMRVAEIQPFVKAGCLKIVKGCEGEEAFFDEVSRFTMDGTDTFDILDTIRDMVAEGRPVPHDVEQDEPGYGRSFSERQSLASMRLNASGFRGGGI